MMSFEKFEHDFWESASIPYDEGFGTITAQTVPHLLNAVHLQKNQHLLDIACGPGYGIPEGMKRDAHITGLDFSSAMIALAKKRFPSALLKIGDAQNLPFAAQSFDAAICAFGLMHFPDPEQAVREAYRILKPGARYAFTVWSVPDPTSDMGFMIEAIKTHGTLDIAQPEGPDFFQFSDFTRARTVLEQTGFTNIKTDILKLVWNVPSLDHFMRAFTEGGARIGGILRAQKPTDMIKIREHLEESLAAYKNNGTYAIPACVVMASATK